jgi:hypothetical protein
VFLDPDFRIIRAFGIPNETVKSGTFGYGIPHPGVYIIDPNGKVIAKYFEEAQRPRGRCRYLAGKFEARPGEAWTVAEAVRLRIITVAGNSVTRLVLCVTLALDVVRFDAKGW